MAFLGFRRRGREHERERERSDRNRDERRYSADERFARDRGRDIGDYYGPQRYGANPFERPDEFGQNRGDPRNDWRMHGGERDEDYGRQFASDRWQESYGARAREQGTHGAYWSPERSSFSDYGRGGEMSTYGAGQFRGRGPKGYRRSDERIREDVCESLTEDERIDATNVEVQVKDCEVTLTGTVNSREEKRRAEDLIDSLPGVRDINNNLRVVNEGGVIEGTGRSRQPGIPGQPGPEQGSRH